MSRRVSVNTLAKELEKLLISKRRAIRKPKPKTKPKARRVKKRRNNQKGTGPSHSNRIMPYVVPEPEPLFAEPIHFDPERPSVLPPLTQDSLEYILKYTIAKRRRRRLCANY